MDRSARGTSQDTPPLGPGGAASRCTRERVGSEVTGGWARVRNILNVFSRTHLTYISGTTSFRKTKTLAEGLGEGLKVLGNPCPNPSQLINFLFTP